MNFSQLKQSLDNPKKIYLLEGEDSFFRTRGEELIKNKFLTEPDFNLSNFDGAQIKSNPDFFVSALGMCPFLGDYRIIVVSEWYPTSADFKIADVKRFFNLPLTNTILIINNASKSEQIKKQASVEVVDCKKGDGDLIARYIQSEARKSNLIISRSNCNLISEFCLFDMSKIAVEVEKLIAFCMGEAEITADVINDLVTKETDYKVYEIVTFISEKNNDKAYEILNGMTDPGDRQMLLVSLYYHFRRLLYVSISSETDAEIASRLEVKEYAVKKSREQARKFLPKRLMKITEKLIRYDSGFKSGEIALNQALTNAVFMILTEE